MRCSQRRRGTTERRNGHPGLRDRAVRPAGLQGRRIVLDDPVLQPVLVADTATGDLARSEGRRAFIVPWPLSSVWDTLRDPRSMPSPVGPGNQGLVFRGYCDPLLLHRGGSRGETGSRTSLGSCGLLGIDRRPVPRAGIDQEVGAAQSRPNRVLRATCRKGVLNALVRSLGIERCRG